MSPSEVALKVKASVPMSHMMYLGPGRTILEKYDSSSPPPRPASCVRVVCISDTHNEHKTLRLPSGDLLIHSGDCLTESGLRHVLRKESACVGSWREIIGVKPQGVQLFERFAEWFGDQKFQYKIFVAGNHDLVVQGLGKQRVQSIFDKHCTYGEVVYLEHEEVNIGNLRVFGSPYANYGGSNDAFKQLDVDYTDVPSGIDIVVTHMPNILPGKGGAMEENRDLGNCLHRTGASLHVSGHCHWAYGAYSSKSKAHIVPCVVASVCSSDWIMSHHDFAGEGGVRGDPKDFIRGGYNIHYPPIVCDLSLPTAMLSPNPKAVARATPATLHLGAESYFALADSFSAEKEEGADGQTETSKPRLLFFGPPNDPGTVERLKPKLSEYFDIDLASSSACAARFASEHLYAACVAKLGTEGNMGTTVLEALRTRQGDTPFIVVHSATAVSNPKTSAFLVSKFDVNGIFDHESEEQLLEALEQVAARVIRPSGLRV